MPEDIRFLLLLLLSCVVTGASGDISKELRDTVSTPRMVRAWREREDGMLLRVNTAAREGRFGHTEGLTFPKSQWGSPSG